MLVKIADDKQPALEELQKLLKRADLSAAQRKAITKETVTLLASIKNEKEAAYDLEFEYKSSEYSILLHDLRFEVNGKIAQIDHLLVTRGLSVYAFDTKSFKSGVKINESGEFTSWNSYWKCYESIPSPVAQNQLDIAVLNDLFKTNKLTPKIIPFVLISDNSTLDRAEKFLTNSVIKCDDLDSVVEEHIEKTSFMDIFTSKSKLVSKQKLAKIGRFLKSSHKPIQVNYHAKFGLSEVEAAAV